MIKLYDFELSVNCYKQRLMLGILGVDYESVPICRHGESEALQTDTPIPRPATANRHGLLHVPRC